MCYLIPKQPPDRRTGILFLKVMTMNVAAKFEATEDEYLEFDRVENKRSSRPDLHAFMLLDELFPRDRDMVCAAEHDQIWLDVSAGEIDTLLDEHIVELQRCGFWFCSDNESLTSFA